MHHLIYICGRCRAKMHSGEIKADTLWRIVAQREDKTVEEVREIVRRAKT